MSLKSTGLISIFFFVPVLFFILFEVFKELNSEGTYFVKINLLVCYFIIELFISFSKEAEPLLEIILLLGEEFRISFSTLYIRGEELQTSFSALSILG